LYIWVVNVVSVSSRSIILDFSI